LKCTVLKTVGRIKVDRTSKPGGLVPDLKVPFVPPEKEYKVVVIREGERVVIPCRGSVEELNVTLHTVSNR